MLYLFIWIIAILDSLIWTLSKTGAKTISNTSKTFIWPRVHQFPQPYLAVKP